MVDIEDGGFIQLYLRRLSCRGGGLGSVLCSLFLSRMMISSIATNAYIRNQISKLKSSQIVCDK